ncbi:MAG: hypothetical protein J6A63_09975 [Clostridia bacterium]|nr:hypothetical protein [Clostridia bacterium]
MLKAKRLLSFVVATAAVSTALGVGVAVANAADNYTFALQTPIATELDKGDTFTVPKGKFGNVDATACVYAPDGDVHTGNSVYLDTHGTYTVQYTAKAEGKTLVHEETFTAGNPSYYFSGEGSSAAYVEKDENAQRGGLKVSLAKGETFYYNEIVNMNGYGATDPAVKLTVSPKTLGKFDAKLWTVTFRDVYDYDNKVDIYVALTRTQTSAGAYWGATRARANDQNYKAFDNSSSDKLYVNAYGTYFNMYSNDVFSVNNDKKSDLLGNQFVGFWVDPATNEVHVSWYHFNTRGVHSSRIIDLDDISYQESLFEGFKTGEVRVEIKCDDYTEETADILLLNMGDNDLTTTVVKDAQAPEITLEETGGFDEQSLPYGSKGMSYPVPSATARDNNDGFTAVETRVFYRYTRKSGVYHDTENARYVKEIPVINGRFATKDAGEYAICYRTADYNGNYTEKVVTVTVESTITPVSAVKLQTGYDTAVEQGNRVFLATAEPCTGGVGEIAYSYTVKKDGKQIPVSGNEKIGYSFIPTAVGEYTVEVTATDFLGTSKSAQYTVTVTAQTQAAFDKGVALPKYMFADAKYILPNLYGTTASGTKQAADITIIDGSGSRSYTRGAEVTLSPDDDGNATFVYAIGESKQTYTRPVLTVKGEDALLMENYFLSKKATVSTDVAGIKLDMAEDAFVEFANAQLASGFTTAVLLHEMGKTFNAFTITLTDSEDTSAAIQLGFAYNQGAVDLYVDGALKVASYYKEVTADMRLDLGYDETNQGWLVGSTNRFTATKTVYKQDFQGFASGKVYVEYAFTEVTAPTTAHVAQIFNQTFGSTVTSDSRIPNMKLMGDFVNLLLQKGTTIDLYSAIAADVLSPYTKVSLTVELDMQTQTATDGTLLDGVQCTDGISYQLELNELGTYYITYRATDWYNRRYEMPLMVVVGDVTAPEIFVDGDMPKTGYKNTYIRLPEYSTADDLSANITSYMTVWTPENKVIYITDSKFYAYVAGEYKIYIYAMDESGNCAQQVYTLTVK